MSDRMTERPGLHFAPQQGWINDPNGLLYDGKLYHLFVQHNPHDIVWGPMHWLHAVSEDMLNWREMGIALYPDEKGTIFSGSAVIDADTTAGFGHGAIIAMYTQHGERECQGIAHSLDGVSFIPYEGNPVIPNPGIPNFRDPKVFWYEKGRCWAMVLAAGERLEFYRSPNLKDWTKTGAFEKGKDRYGRIFECPDLFSLIAPDGREVWALLSSMTNVPEEGGGRILYDLGEYDGETFRADVRVQDLMLDAGPDDYAGVTFNGTPDRIYMAWAANPAYARRTPADGYRGMMTLPRKLKLVETQAGLRLAAEPVLPEGNPVPVRDGAALPQGAFEIRLHATGPFEVLLVNPIKEQLKFGLDGDNHIYVDRTNAGASSFDLHYGSHLYSLTRTPRLTTGDLEMRVILDRTIAELYADQGAYVNTSLIFPAAAYSSIHIVGNALAEVSSIGINRVMV